MYDVPLDLDSQNMFACTYVCALIFMGFIFCRFCIFADFAFLNLQLLTIVPYVSINA